MRLLLLLVAQFLETSSDEELLPFGISQEEVISYLEFKVHMNQKREIVGYLTSQ